MAEFESMIYIGWDRLPYSPCACIISHDYHAIRSSLLYPSSEASGCRSSAGSLILSVPGMSIAAFAGGLLFSLESSRSSVFVVLHYLAEYDRRSRVGRRFDAAVAN